MPANEANDFNINLGDTIYSDSELAGAAVARAVPEKWGKYKLGLALPPSWEVVTGPVATNSFANEIDGFLGQRGSGTAIRASACAAQPSIPTATRRSPSPRSGSPSR